MQLRTRAATRRTALAGAVGLCAALAAGVPAHTANAAPPAPSSPLVPIGESDMATLAHDTTYRLSPQLAQLLGMPLDTVLDGSKLGALQAAARPTLPGAPTPAVGTTLLWPALDGTENGGPVGIYLKQYTLRAVGDKIEVWVASGTDDVSAGTAFPAGDCRNMVAGSTTITDAQVQGLVKEFDGNIYPIETKAFSTPPDRAGTFTVPGLAAVGVDFTGDGDHTVTLVDNVRDENFYEFPKNRSYIAGFYAPIFNQITDRNIMTIDAFDWAHRTGANPKDEAAEDVCKSRPARPRSYEGVFAHEWQHLLQQYQDADETIWVNEGLSDMAISLTGYGDARRGIDRTRGEGHIFCFQGYGDIKGPSNPNPRPCGGPQNSLTLWQDEGTGSEILADYGNTWSFMLYLADRFGPAIISTLHRDATAQGLASVQKALDTVAKGTKVGDVLHDFQLMNLLDKAVDTKGATVRGIGKGRVTTASLDASVNLASPSAYAAPGAAPNGADYVLLRDGGKALTGAGLRSLTFTGTRTAEKAATQNRPVTFSLPLLEQDSTTSTPVQGWHVNLVGIDKAGDRVLVKTVTSGFTGKLGAKALAAFASYPTLVAVVSHDAPDEANQPTGYARYSLKVNGTTQRGG